MIPVKSPFLESLGVDPGQDRVRRPRKHRKKPPDRHAPRRRACHTCMHPERVRIEALLAGGASLESISQKFGVHKAALHRHMHRHVNPEDLEILKGAPAQLAGLAEKAAAENMSILDYLSIMRSRLMRQLEASSAAGDNPGVCRASQTMLSVLQELGKLTGEIDLVAGIVINNNSNNQTLVQMTDPLIVRLQSGLLRTLAPFPDARRAVILMLADLEAGEYRPAMTNGHALPPPAEIEARANG